MTEPGPQLETAEQIPDKLYFRIGEASRLLGVRPYVLRYWETEFPDLAPKKTGTGHRLYRRRDVELLLEIKHLLYEKRYTIEGARRYLELRNKPAAPKRPARRKQPDLFSAPPALLANVRDELASILKLLK